MNTWEELKKYELQRYMVECMESLRPAIYQIISGADEVDSAFDYYVDCSVDHKILLFDDGFEFAAADTDQFKHPGEFIKWVVEAINTYYYDEDHEGEEDGN